MRILITSARALVLFASLIFFSLSLADDSSPSTPHQRISQLTDELYVIGETSADYSKAQAAVEESVAAIEAFVDVGDKAVLTAKSSRGQTPLIAAAVFGYASIVEALLVSEAVREDIDARDASGLSAWDHANLASRRSIWACRDMLRTDPFTLIPLLVTAYWHSQGDAYAQTRTMLEKSHAAADIERPRAYWLERCTGWRDQTRAAVLTSTDLLKTLVEQGDESLENSMSFLNE